MNNPNLLGVNTSSFKIKYKNIFTENIYIYSRCWIDAKEKGLNLYPDPL